MEGCKNSRIVGYVRISGKQQIYGYSIGKQIGEILSVYSSDGMINDEGGLIFIAANAAAPFCLQIENSVK